MKQFQAVMENAIKSSQLTRVKLKVDPAFCSQGEISKYQGYVGYILAEDGEKVRLYLECGGECEGMVVTVPHNMIDIEQSLTPFDRLKIVVLRHLKQHHGLTKEDGSAHMIASATSPEALEAFCVEHGMSERDLMNLYKQQMFA
jgi:ribosomal protein L21E